MLFKSVSKFRDERATLTKHTTKKFPTRSVSKITTIIVHHSLTKSGSAKAFSNYHVKSNGWPGIGYHFVIEKDGDIVWCNDLETKSYHVGNSNGFCVGICLIGDFRSEEPTNEQLESLFKLSKALMEDLNITSEFVKGHSEMPGYSTKACPVIGMDDLRTKIKEYNEGGELPTFIENTGVPELPKNTYHTVVRGDTLWNIAEDHGNMTVRELLLLNPSINPRKITLGQEIRIK
jgi:LysM repeat protein